MHYPKRMLCKSHYARVRNHGELADLTTPIINRFKDKGGCSAPLCTRKEKVKGFCDAHYRRTRAGASLDAPLTERRNDDGDRDWYDHEGYLYRRVRRPNKDGQLRWVQEAQHRVIMEEHLGRKLMAHENVHHINGMRGDNRVENLEIWNTSQPAGQRIYQKLDWAKSLLESYGYTVNEPG